MKTKSFSFQSCYNILDLISETEGYLNLTINVLYEKMQKKKNSNILSKYYTQINTYISWSDDQIV